MLRNYIKTSLRNLYRQWKVTAINLLGLVIAFTIAVFVTMYVYKQYTYDKFNVHYKNIYRLEHKEWSLLASGVAPHVKQNFPEIDKTSRVGFAWENNTLNYKQNLFVAKNMAFTDNDFFDIFSLKIISGNKATLLSQPYSVVLSENLARKIFGNEDPVGKTIKYNNQIDYTITGVVENRNDFHIQYDLIADFISLKDIRGGGETDFLWDLGPQNYLVYVLLNPDIEINSLENKISDYFVGKKPGWTKDAPPHFWLRKFSDIYLNSDIKYEMGCIHTNPKMVMGFILVGLLVLLIAIINYINITIARGMSRNKEISMRKIVGAGRGKVFTQLIIESIILSAIAFIISLLIVIYSSGNVFTYLTDMRMELSDLPLTIFIFLILITILAGFFAGLYPSVFMSAVSPLKIFKTSQTAGVKKNILKQVLIILQFTISVVLIIGAFMVNAQYKFMRNKDLGFNLSQVIVLHLPKDANANKEIIKNKLREHPNVITTSYSQQIPGSIRNTSAYVDGDINEPYRVQFVDPDYASLLEIELLDGRNHNWDILSDKVNAWVINETAMKRFQIPRDSVIGYQLKGWGGEPKTVIGLMKDFHFNALQQEIIPLVFIWYDWAPKLNIKVNPANLPETIHYIQKVWQEFVPGHPFNYVFMDNAFNEQYKIEEKLSTIFTIFAFIAVLIAAIGMYGLASYMAEQNKRQISIRKVYGASLKDILIRFSREFLILVLISNLIAWPIAYFMLENWLSKFPYRIAINLWIFILSGIISILIACIIVIYNAYSTANKNPAEVLRYE